MELLFRLMKLLFSTHALPPFLCDDHKRHLFFLLGDVDGHTVPRTVADAANVPYRSPLLRLHMRVRVCVCVRVWVGGCVRACPRAYTHAIRGVEGRGRKEKGEKRGRQREEGRGGGALSARGN